MKVNIQDTLSRRGWSQAELSRRSGIPQPMISQIITGEVKLPRVDTMFKLAKALRCMIEDLIEEDAS